MVRVQERDKEAQSTEALFSFSHKPLSMRAALSDFVGTYSDTGSIIYGTGVSEFKHVSDPPPTFYGSGSITDPKFVDFDVRHADVPGIVIRRNRERGAVYVHPDPKDLGNATDALVSAAFSFPEPIPKVPDSKGLNVVRQELSERVDGVVSALSALGELRRLKRLPNNWDGSNADAARHRSFRLAEMFIGLLVGYGKAYHYSPQIFATGDAVLEVEGDGVEAQFRFIDDGTVSTVIDRPEEWDADVPGFDGSELPKQILERLGLAKRTYSLLSQVSLVSEAVSRFAGAGSRKGSR